jgi:hypothetical protein
MERPCRIGGASLTLGASGLRPFGMTLPKEHALLLSARAQVKNDRRSPKTYGQLFI